MEKLHLEASGKKKEKNYEFPGRKVRSVSWDWGFHLPNRKRVQIERCYAGENLRISSDSEAASRVWAYVCWIGWAYWRKQISAHRFTERVTIKSEDRIDSLHSQRILNQKQMRVQRTWGEQTKPNHFNTKLQISYWNKFNTMNSSWAMLISWTNHPRWMRVTHFCKRRKCNRRCYRPINLQKGSSSGESP